MVVPTPCARAWRSPKARRSAALTTAPPTAVDATPFYATTSRRLTGTSRRRRLVLDDLGREEPRLAAQVVGPRVVHGRPVRTLQDVGAAQRDVAAARALVRVVQARARRRPFDLGRDALLARRRGLRLARAEHFGCISSTVRSCARRCNPAELEFCLSRRRGANEAWSGL